MKFQSSKMGQILKGTFFSDPVTSCINQDLVSVTKFYELIEVQQTNPQIYHADFNLLNSLASLFS